MANLRKSLQRFGEDLQLFAGQLSQETQELKRNVELRPVTGATNFRHCLEDINDRLIAVAEELQALEAVSLDAISLEELVGHCVALYQQNHTAIEHLEQRLQQYGYRDVYAPLPPENPLDMLLLRAPASIQQHQQQTRMLAASPGRSPAPEAACTREPLDHITNSLAASGLHDDAPGSALPARTAVKAMAPMTAAKARVRSDTPSSLSSPYEAMSPSMRELLGKYASSSGGPPTQYSGTPFSHSSTPPVMGQLTPAFAAARLASERQAAAGAGLGPAAEGTPAGSEGRTPEAMITVAGWQADATMYNVLTATAKKLASKPDFMEQYRQRFPHIVASTERLLASVEKQQPPPDSTATAGVTAQQQQHGGPGSEAARPSRLDRSVEAIRSWHSAAEEETTMQLYSQVISSQPYPTAAEDVAAPAEEAVASADLTPARGVGPGPGAGITPSTKVLLSRAFSATGQGTNPPAALGSSVSGGTNTSSAGPNSVAVATSIARTTSAQLAAAGAPSAGPAGGADAPASSAARPDRSRPDLQEAIEAALRRSANSVASAPASAASSRAGSPTSASLGSSTTAASGSGTTAKANPWSSGVAAQVQLVAPPPLPPRQAAVAAAPAFSSASGTPQQEMIPLRPVAEQDYESLPSFIKGQLTLGQVNEMLGAVHRIVSSKAAAGGMAGFTLEDLEGLGLGAKAKVFINSIVKLNRAQLKVVYGQGTVYLLL